MRAGRSTLAVLLVAIVVSSALAMPAAAGTPTASASGGTAAPGETVTVTVDVENAQTAKLSSIPSGWTIQSIENDSAAATYVQDTYVGWAWGEDQAGQTVSVTLAVPADADSGEYTLDAVVEDSDGNKARSTAMATVETTDTTPPVADAGSDVTVDRETSVAFDGTASADDKGIVSYEWAFGDGATAAGPTPSHTYDGPGTYEVTLTVTDEGGNEATDTLTVTVEEATTSVGATTVGANEPTTEPANSGDETAETETTTQPAGSDRSTGTTTAGSGDGDGFTLVAAIVGVVATMLVASRRRF